MFLFSLVQMKAQLFKPLDIVEDNRDGVPIMDLQTLVEGSIVIVCPVRVLGRDHGGCLGKVLRCVEETSFQRVDASFRSWNSVRAHRPVRVHNLT